MTQAEIYSVTDNSAHLQGRRHTLNVACGPVKDRVERSGGDTGSQDGEKGNKSILHFVGMRVDEMDESENVNLCENGDEKAKQMVDW
jgi:putative NADPH-quinone reductase